MDIEAGLARKIAEMRQARGWSLADLATRSGVSRSMLSKIERREASPTATTLVRIATAFELTLAALLTETGDSTPRLLRRTDQPTWIDPATGYRRRQVFLSAASPLELVEVELPAGAQVAVPASSYALLRHLVWVLDGVLTLVEGQEITQLEQGDRLEFGAPSDVVYRNDRARPCRYVVAVLRG